MYNLKLYTWLRFIVMTVFVLVLTSCSSTYYKFTPPDSTSGRACVNECLKNRSTCRINCDTMKMQYDSMNNMNNVIHDITKKKSDQQSSVNHNYYDSYSCHGNCEDDYKTCYRNCGGSVEIVDSAKPQNDSMQVSQVHTNNSNYGTLSYPPGKIK